MKKYILCVLLLFSPIICSSVDVSVVARPPYRKENEKFLRDNIVGIFTLKNRVWIAGEPLQVFILPKDSIYTKAFARKYLQMTPQGYFDILEANQASGRGQVPIIVEAPAELVMRVLNTEGSIGYADENILANIGNRVFVIH